MNSNLDSAVDSAAEDPAAARGAADSAAGTPSAAPRRPRFGLLPRILVAIVLAIGLGLVMPESIARVFTTFNGIFSGFLGFLIPLIIVGLVTPAIAELGRGAGKMLAATTGIAYLSTVLCGLFALGISLVLLPRMLDGASIGTLENPEDSAIAAYFDIEIPPVFDVMTALVLSFCLGIGLTLVKKGALQESFEQLRTIIVRIIEAIIVPLLPLYIFGMFLGLTMNGQIWTVIGTFLAVILLVFAMTVVVLLAQYGVAGLAMGSNPLRMLGRMLPAYMTALGTSSSAATIPVTVECTKRNGIPDAIADFVIPLGATIHLAGSTLKITTFAVAIMIVTGMGLNVPALLGFVFMLGIVMIAAPGVPGGAIMAAASVLSSILGFDDAAVGLMIAAYIAIDSFGTATNVTGDGAIAAVMTRLSKGRVEGDLAAGRHEQVHGV
ncbi:MULTISPECIES: dicarboxylate/amino acid:cation symporter [Brachybacterium]|uniref:Dicarboxylate/amino acid:cation symporter n=2 Tax=Brachybacterium TaxID=43668 RepID=A0A426SPD8_9MICO|nr:MULTISPECIES: dicarboxylate/amino acid:cation symporter [Brachybacterium]RRR20209.1 dicarboxylate/amino acid:cation symporter [Brachybacterium paraconglomeratum]GLI32073.1 sodium:proton antiporter [Brachybacterium conglomeratum]GLK03607.1 sodium:proton antiporter [Brachybacterium conglomeratum]